MAASRALMKDSGLTVVNAARPMRAMAKLCQPFAKPLLALLFIVPLQASAQQLFRFKDDTGQIVITDRLPPEVIPRGYEVLDRNGRVTKTVQRQLNAAERAAKQLEDNARAADALAKAKLLEWDQSLLRRYSSVADIKLAKVRAINDVQVRIDILKNNLESVIAQVASEQSAAADYERRSGRVPQEILDDIAQHKLDVGEAQRLIYVREQELAALITRFDRDIARFTKLYAQVNKLQ